MIEKVFQYGGILVQKHVLTRYFGFYSDSHYQWYEGRERKEGFKGKREGEREREARGGRRGRRGKANKKRQIKKG